MSRFVPSSSRIPGLSGSSSSSLSASTLGKRAAGEAGLDSSSLSGSTRTAPGRATPSGHRPLSLSSSASSNAGALANAQSKLMAAEKQRALLELENEQLRGEVQKYKGQRNRFHEGMEQEQGVAEQREKEWQDERTRLNAQLSGLRTEYNATEEALQSLRSAHTQLTSSNTTLKTSYKTDIAQLQGRIKDLEEQRRDASNWKKRAEALSIELEEEKRKAGEGKRAMEDKEGDKKGDDVLKKELRRQSATFALTQQRVQSLQVECQDLLSRNREAEAALRESKASERSLRESLRTVELQLERARRDMDSLTSSFPSPSSASASASEDTTMLQSRLSTLTQLHAEATAEVAKKDAELRALQQRHDEYVQQQTSVMLDWRGRATEAERELRWAKEGRVTAEKREEGYRRQVEALTRDQAGSSAGSGADAGERVAQLESLVATLREQIDDFSRDSRETEERVTKGAGLVKQSLLDSAEARIAQMQKDIEALESSISELASANTSLDAEVADLMRRVASGEHNPQVERVLEQRDNPASRAHAVRTQQLEELKAENAALLARLKDVDRAGTDASAGQGQGLVPRESYDRLLKEKEDMEAAHAKRLQRLKEIFMTKSKEFLEAVYSLLGWRIKFDESGKDIRLTSMYAPKGKMGLTLKFASQEGHFGTMQMMGGMARGLEDARRFWIMERQSVPGFLAQVTTEMFEKTTMGRNAGYIGLE